jgi:GntR family transcriptional regulator
MIIDRTAPISLHNQLAALIKNQIAAGIYTPGSSLPSEREMCEQFGISRTTVREALHRLEREGLIRKAAGRGVFVAELQRNLAIHVSLNGYSSDIKRGGGFPSSSLVSAEIIQSPSIDLLKAMVLESGDEVVKIVRIRYNNNIPLALHIVHLNHRYCPHILDHNLAKDSLFRILPEEYGIRLVRAVEQIYAGLANQEELNMLNLTYPSAVLHSERTTYNEKNEVVEFSHATYCGENYRMVVNLDTENK